LIVNGNNTDDNKGASAGIEPAAPEQGFHVLGRSTRETRLPASCHRNGLKRVSYRSIKKRKIHVN
jgi:hypothetical protein